MRYVEIPESQVRANVQWTVPAEHQGQMVEVAYGGFSKHVEAGPGDPYKRVTDQAITGASRRTGEGVSFFARMKEPG